MDISNFIYNVEFEGVVPEDSDVSCINAEMPDDRDMRITTLPINNQEIKKRLLGLMNVPRMSSFAIGAIINYAVSQMPEEHAYVNIGVWAGYSLFCGMLGNEGKQCIGIDNFSEFITNNPRKKFYKKFTEIRSDNHIFFEIDYREFFKWYQGQIGVYFYDGSHCEADQYNGLACAEKFFSDDCIVIVDDYNGLPVQLGTEKFINESLYHYETIFKQFTNHGYHPTYWNGFFLMRKK